MTLKPPWIKARALTKSAYNSITSISKEYNLHTICQEALCPNIGECWASKSLTFLILGNICTRNCSFCSVQSDKVGIKPDNKEPVSIAKAVKELNLKHAVITSVTRDDLKDGGARHFALTIAEIRKFNLQTGIEALIPDFNGNEKSLKVLISSCPDVVGHNIETVKRLTPIVRDEKTDYDRSLKVLKSIKKLNPRTVTKSAIQLGLGETDHEIKETLMNLRQSEVDIVVIGQYLKPSMKQTDIREYINPALFDYYAEYAYRMGFKKLISYPFARSSYKAGDY